MGFLKKVLMNVYVLLIMSTKFTTSPWASSARDNSV